MRIPIANESTNVCQTGGGITFRNHFAVHPDSFAKADEVRGGKEPGAIFCGAANRIDHRADRAFAVRASDVDDAGVSKIDIELGNQPANVFEAEFDAEALKAVKPGERLFV